MLPTFGALACGNADEQELFAESTDALSKALGDRCESDGVYAEGEVNVDQSLVCEPGLCVTRGGEGHADEGFGICSCRCDGPADTGPFCSCGDGFVCQHLIDDLGLGQRNLVGSYCLPED